MDENALNRLLTALEEQTKATLAQTAAINKLIESNAEVVDLLLGQMAEVEDTPSKPQYLGTRS